MACGELLRDLGEDREPGAHIVGALGVMGGEGSHGAWMGGLHLLLVGVEVLEREAVAAGISTYLVESGEPIEAIESCIFNPLGHDGEVNC